MEEEDHHAICTAMLSLLLPLFFFFFLAPHLFLKLCACIALLSPLLGFVSLILGSAFVTLSFFFSTGFVVVFHFFFFFFWDRCYCEQERKTGRIEFNAATIRQIIINSFV
jgi:hypothetical protein